MIKLFRFLKPFKIQIFFIILLMFFQTISELYLPNLMSDIVDTGIVNGDTKFILGIGGIMLLIALLATIAAITGTYLSSKAAIGFGKIIRNKIFNKVENFSLNEFDKVGTSSLITRTTNDVTQVQNALIMILRMLIRAPIMAVGGIIMASQKDSKLTLILTVTVPVMALVIGIVAKKGIPLFKSMQVKLDKINLVLRETLTGIRVIRAFNRIDSDRKKFDKANRDLTDTAIKVNKIIAVLMPIMMITFNLTTIAVIWFGAIRIDTGSMQVGDLMAFIQYIMQIMFAIIIFTMMFVMIPRASASAVRINQVLNINSDINDIENPVNNISRIGSLSFENVTFSYHGADEPAIKNISFSANPGEITAIIGGTGSGKSTLINLIPRFYNIDSGCIKINNIDISKFSQEDLRKRIGLVPQKAILFSGTIKENIMFGKDNASDEEITNAAKTAQALEFINRMPDKFESYISQGGKNFSGGQKQRISMARALVRKPEIYLFDDSFSALDFRTDASLRKALKKETKDSTVLIVAQRVSTVMNADRILVMDNGKLISSGTHKELLKTCNIYREIVASQLSEEELANEVGI